MAFRTFNSRGSGSVALKESTPTHAVPSRRSLRSAAKEKCEASEVNLSTMTLASKDNLGTFPIDASKRMVPRNAYHTMDRPLLSIGERGHGLSQFYYPVDVAVSPGGDIYVVDSDNCRVQIFDHSGSFVGTFGSYGHEKGEHNWWPTGIAVNSQGQVIVSNANSLNSIGVYNRDGTFRYSFSESGSGFGQVDHPMGVAVDTSDNIYVCDTWNERVQVFQNNGQFLRTFGLSGHGSGELSHPAYIAVDDRTDLVYVTDWDKHAMSVFSKEGEFLSSFGSRGEGVGEMNHPSGITIDEQGFIILSERDNNRVHVYYDDGTLYCAIGSSMTGSEAGQFNQPRGIALTKHGNVIVADSHNHRIQIF